MKIAICGKMCSGKTTLANTIMRMDPRYKRYSFGQKIKDLATKMVHLSGLEVKTESNPHGDIEIKCTGLRPGEKLYEELLVGGKSTPTENQLIKRAEEKMISWNKLEPILIEIKEASINEETEKIYKLLRKLVPEFKKDISSTSTNY